MKKKITRNITCFLLVSAFFIGLVPLPQIRSASQAATLPEGAYIQDATWADNSPVNVELPPSIAYDDSVLQEYEYMPRTERTALSEEREAADDYEAQLQMYLDFVNEELYGSDTDILLRGLLLDGYSLNQVLSAYGVSRALDIDIRSLLTDKASDINNRRTVKQSDAQLPDSLSPTDKRNYELLAADLGVRADTLAKYGVDNGLSFREVEVLTYAAPAYISALSTLDEPSRGGTEDPQIKVAGAPYSYDHNQAEKVNLNTGGLVYEVTDYVLPGVNGLDLVIGRRYDSEQANIYIPREYYGSSIAISDVYADSNFYQLAYGWSFMFSSIMGNRLYLADGRSFELNGSSLFCYSLKDVRIETANYSYQNGYVSSYYAVYYKDGKREYFDANGVLIGIQDKYNNTIKFVHDTYNGQPRVNITDTLGRVTTITTQSSGANYTVTVTLPTAISLKYDVTSASPPPNYATYKALTAYTDPMNIVTNYGYTLAGGGFDIFHKLTNGTMNYFVNLTSITHPTGAMSEFIYEPVEKNLGSQGLQTLYRITSRKDKIGSAIYNEKIYTYSGNNSGWPTLSDPRHILYPNELPTGYVYGTTVKTLATGLTESHTFNSKHLTTGILTMHGVEYVQQKLFEYNTYKLPTKIATNTYDYFAANVMQSIEMTEYDMWANVTASWSPLANGSTSNTDYKTTYTYDTTYSQPLSITYKQNASTTIAKTYTLDSAKRHPVSEVVTANNVQKEKTDWTYDSYGNVLSEKRYGTEVSTQLPPNDTVTRIAAGGNHSLVVKNDGTVWTFGQNNYGQLGNGTTTNSSTPVQVSSLSGVVATAGGYYHSIALKSDGTVWAWGQNNYGQLGDGTTTNCSTPVQVSNLSGVVAIAGGYYHSIALKSDGTVWAWGQNNYGQLGNGTTPNSSTPVQVSNLSGVTTIFGGNYHSISIKSDGTVWTWGCNSHGQLGDGTTTNRSAPVKVSSLSGITAIAGGSNYSIALKSDGTVWACGENIDGQIGNGNTAYITSTPTQVLNLTGVTAIAGGDAHCFALKSNGTVWAWGANYSGQLGDATILYVSYSPVQVSALSGFTTFAAGSSHTLALKNDGTVWDWGANNNGQLGDGTILGKTTPEQIIVLQIDSDLFDSVLTEYTYQSNAYLSSIKTSGVLPGYSVPVSSQSYTYDTLGRLTKVTDPRGYATQYQYNNKNDLIKVTNPDNTLRQYALSYTVNYTTVTDEKGTQIRTSYTALGQPYEVVDVLTNTVLSRKTYDALCRLVSDEDLIGGGTTTYTYDHLSRVTSATVKQYDLIVSASASLAVAAGNYHSLILKNDGTVCACGYNNYGQLGDGTTTNRSTPVQVSGLSGVIAISAGGCHSIALKSDGTVWAWGQNNCGQLGNGTTTNSSTPVQASSLSGITAIAAGPSCSLFLKSNGTVWACGENIDGQIGNGNTAYITSTPTQVLNLTGITAITVGSAHCFALKNDGTVWGWGCNHCGQLGDAAIPYISYSPVQVSNLSGFTSLMGGGSHSLARKSNGTAWAWGGNTCGQLGDGTTANHSIPAQINGLSSVTAISAGIFHSVALKSDGTVWAWGQNTYGQLGDGTIINRSTPVQVNVVSLSYSPATLLTQENYAYSVITNDPAGAPDPNGLFKVTKTQAGDGSAPSVVTASYINNMGLEAKTSAMLNGTEYFDTFTYDYLGNKTQARSAWDASNGRAFTTKWEYDYAGRVTKETNALNQFSTRAYDALGRNVSVTDPAGNVTTFAYDALGRLVRQETPFEQVGGTVYNAVKKYAYDQAGHVTSEQTQNSLPGAAIAWARTDYTYNNRGFLTAADSYDGANVASRVTYTYDAVGNMLTQTTGASGGSPAVTTYTYDRFGNVLSVKDPLNQTESYTYDLAGHTLTHTDRNGAVTTYTYDGLGRPLTANVVKSGVNTGTSAQSYTLTGQLKNQSNSGFTATNTYDALGRLTQVSETGSVVKTYTYDLGGNRLTYNTTVNGAAAVNTGYEYDELARLKIIKENNVTQATYTYDVNGNRASLAYANGVTVAYTYNLANLVTSLQNKLGAVVQSSFAYTYYLDGNQRTKLDNAGKTTTYTYDGLGRLTQEAESGGSGAVTMSYVYDTRGNRASMAVSGAENYTVTYTYDLNNRLTQTVKGAETSTYQYDANGNQLAKLGSGGTELYAYDGFNQMTSTGAGGTTTTYDYRPDGLRHSKTTGSATTTHVWDGSNISADITGGTTTKYVRGINLIASVNGSAYTYALYNAHGDVVQLTNSSGAVTKGYSYDAFGVESNPDAGDVNPWRYCGEYWDKETGTVYLRARYYNPLTARMLSPDPKWNPYNSIYGDPSSYPMPNIHAIRKNGNLYVCCMNNPIMFVDPSGLDAIFMTQSNGALGAGHSAIAIQDENEKWWFMSFEPVGNERVFGSSTPIPIVGVIFAELQLIEWNSAGDYMKSAYYDYLKDTSPKYFEIFDNISKYDSQVYIKGDFTKSVTKAAEYEKNPPGYWLTGRNCAWLSLEVLQVSTSGDTYKRIDNYLWNKIPFTNIHTTRKTIIPNFAKNDIKKLFGIK